MYYKLYQLCHLNNKYRYWKQYVLVISLSYQQFCGLHSIGSISETVRNRTHVHTKFFLRMTDTITSQNIDLSSWDTLYICIYTQHKMLCKSENTNLKQNSWMPSCSVRCAAIPSPYRIQRRYQCFIELSDFICTSYNASPAVPRVLYPFTSRNMAPATFFFEGTDFILRP